MCVGGWEEGFCLSQSRGFAPDEGQIESDRLSQHTAASNNPSGIRLAGQGFVLMQDNYLKHTSKLC